MKSTRAREATARLQSMLVRDKIQAPDGFSEILRADLGRILNDYFDLTDTVAVDVKLTDAADIEINISTKAKRIKTFYCSK